MKTTIVYIVGVFLILVPARLICQVNNIIFFGSPGDGYDVACFEQAANNSIFDGSTGDGYDALCMEQSSNNDIFGGSLGDGYDALCMEQASNNSIYSGSIGDGYDKSCFEEASNNSIYGGSIGDGYDVICFEQSSTNSIFGGSIGDGYDVFCFAQSANNGIFFGSTGDGYDRNCFEQQTSNFIFGGSIGDGYNQVCEIINPIQLPIELLVFDGVLVEDDAILRWVVSSEIDNEFFVLERSIDAFEFEEVAVIASLGNTTNTREYRYTDFVRPLFGNPVVYYRLKQIDLDGSFEYTHTIALNLPMEEETAEYLLYPNPAKEKVFLRYTNPGSEEVLIELYDQLGRQLNVYRVDPLALQAGYPITVDKLPAGTYHLRIIDGSNLATRTFIKVNP